MTTNNKLVGILLRGGYLKTESKEILLTGIQMQSYADPEGHPMDIPLEDIGKTVLVKGDLSGNVLYSAEIVESMSLLSSGFMNALVKKGGISLDEIQNQVTKIICQQTEKKNKLCALVIGHKAASPGAINPNSNLTEFNFNNDLAGRIERKVQKVSVRKVYREKTYSELPGDINALDPDFVVSLHCNAFNGSVSGSEVLYYHNSKKGQEMADILLKHVVDYLELPNRGIKGRTVEDRGGSLLRYTKAPCIIAEPFFIDNDHDLAVAQRNLDAFADVYARAIDDISEIV